MKKYILILLVLCVSPVFAAETYYDKISAAERIIVDEEIKSCVAAATKGQAINEESMNKAKNACNEIVACIYKNFGVDGMMDTQPNQVNFCMEKTGLSVPSNNTQQLKYPSALELKNLSTHYNACITLNGANDYSPMCLCYITAIAQYPNNDISNMPDDTMDKYFEWCAQRYQK